MLRAPRQASIAEGAAKSARRSSAAVSRRSSALASHVGVSRRGSAARASILGGGGPLPRLEEDPPYVVEHSDAGSSQPSEIRISESEPKGSAAGGGGLVEAEEADTSQARRSSKLVQSEGSMVLARASWVKANTRCGHDAAGWLGRARAKLAEMRSDPKAAGSSRCGTDAHRTL